MDYEGINLNICQAFIFRLDIVWHIYSPRLERLRWKDDCSSGIQDEHRQHSESSSQKHIYIWMWVIVEYNGVSD